MRSTSEAIVQPAWPAITLNPAIFVYGLILLTPFGGFYGITFPGGVDFTFNNFLTLLLFPVFIIHCLSRNKFPNLTWVGVLHIIFLFISLSSAIFANNYLAAIRGSVGYLVDNFLCFIYCAAFLRNRSDIDRAVRFFIIAGIISMAMGWIQLGRFALFGKITTLPFVELFGSASRGLKNYGNGSGAFSIPRFMRMMGFLGDAFGPYMLIPATLVSYAASKNSSFRRKTFFRVLAFFLWVTICVTASRSAYVGALSIATFIYFMKRPFLKSSFLFVFRFYKVAFLIVTILGSFYLVRNASFWDQAEIQVDATGKIKTSLFLLQRFDPFMGEGKTVSYFTSHWNLAIQYCTSNFGFGLGSQNFDDFVYERYPVKYGSHSNFILFLGDNGIWGFLAQVLIVMLTLSYGLKTYYLQPSERTDNLPLYLSALFLGLVVTGVVRTFYLAPYSFLVAGLIVQLYKVNRPDTPIISS